MQPISTKKVKNSPEDPQRSKIMQHIMSPELLREVVFAVLGFLLWFPDFFVLFTACWGLKLTFQQYKSLQHFEVQTSYFPWRLQHLGARTV